MFAETYTIDGVFKCVPNHFAAGALAASSAPTARRPAQHGRHLLRAGRHRVLRLRRGRGHPRPLRRRRLRRRLLPHQPQGSGIPAAAVVPLPHQCRRRKPGKTWGRYPGFARFLGRPPLRGDRNRPLSSSSRATNAASPAGRPVRVLMRTTFSTSLSSATRSQADQSLTTPRVSRSPARSGSFRRPQCAAALDHGYFSARAASRAASRGAAGGGSRFAPCEAWRHPTASRAAFKQ